MSRKTKAELEAENRELKDRNDELKDRNDELKDRNENLHGYIKLMHGNFDEDRRHLEIEEKAHDASITKLISLSDKSAKHANKSAKLIEINESRGGSSWQEYRPVHKLAKRFYRMKLRHEPEYFAGVAATKVRKHCLKSEKYKNKHVPAQKTIKNNLIKDD